jgi:hypothetical protein
MAFVNEHISKEDIKKYDLQRICGEHNLPNRGVMHSRTWTIDRDRDAFLIKVWSHRDADFEGWAFYWMGEWMFFEMRPADRDYNRDENSCWFRFIVRKFNLPEALAHNKNEVIDELRAAITESPGGMTHIYSHHSATVEFIEE